MGLLSTTQLPGKATSRGWLLAFCTILIFSIAPPITKTILMLGVDPTTLLALRYLMSVVFLSGTIGLTKPNHLRIDRRGLMFSIAAGLSYGVAVLTFTWSLTRINASVASMIVALYPLLVILLLAWRGEKLTRRTAFRLILGLGGVYLLVGPGGRVDLVGVLLVAVTCFAFAIQLVIMQWFLKGYGAQTVTLYMVAAISVLTTGLWLVQGEAWSAIGWRAWLLIVILAVGSTYLGQLALFTAVRLLGSAQIALLNPLEPLLTLIWSYLFLQERLIPLQLLGVTLILSSMLLAIHRGRR